MADDVQSVLEADPEAEELKDEVEQPEEATPVDASPRVVRSPPRQGRPRLPRDAFPREERWKARLPVALHRTGKLRSL